MNKYVLGVYVQGKTIFESIVKADEDVQGVVKCMQVIPDEIRDRATRINISKEIKDNKYKLLFIGNKDDK